MNLPFVSSTFYKTSALSNTQATKISKGNNGNGANRFVFISQNQSQQNIWLCASNIVDPQSAILLLPGGTIVRDLFAPSDDVYAFTDAAGAASNAAILTVMEGYGQ